MTVDDAQRQVVYAASPGPELEYIPFNALTEPGNTGDALPLSFLRLNLQPHPGAPDKGPIIMVPGAGVRANLFCPPMQETLPLLLAKAGYDVFLMNWRASIDLPPVQYCLDEAALYDFPAAVDKILELTGARQIKAVIHCQGSCAFMMSIAAGLLRYPDGTDKVSVVVANSSALHPLLPRGAKIKLPLALMALPSSVQWFNPQWGIHAPRFWPKLIDWAVRAFHHECANAVCKHSSFVYGFGFATLWRHENPDDATHDWLSGEFAHVPRKLFIQLSGSQVRGRLRRATATDRLPEEFGVDAPKTNARFAFITGSMNKTFQPKAMWRSYRYFIEKSGRKDHTFHEFHGFGHLDIFLGTTAPALVFPYIVSQLEMEEGPSTDA